MAAPDFNTRAAEGNALQTALGPLVAGLAQGAPDCWPKISHAVNAIRVAATRATTRAWDVVDQREASLRQCTNHYYQTLNTVYALQKQLANAVNAVHQWQGHAQALQNQVLQLTRQNTQLHNQLTNLNAQLVSNGRMYASAVAARNAELENRTRDYRKCVTTVNTLRIDDTSCQSQLAHCKQCRS
jgi:chromosome segregation ATPase